MDEIDWDLEDLVEIELKPKKIYEVRFYKDEDLEIREKIDNLVESFDVELSERVMDFVGWDQDVKEFLAQSDYVDKLYFLESVYLFFADSDNCLKLLDIPDDVFVLEKSKDVVSL